MRKLVLLIILTLVLSGCAIPPKDYSPTDDVPEVYFRHDEFKGIYYYRHSTFFRSKKMLRKPVEIYLAEIKGKYIPFIKFEFYETYWIFFDQVTIINNKGLKKQFNIDKQDKFTQVLNESMIYESYQKTLSKGEAEELLILFDEGENDDELIVRIRLSGETYWEKKLFDSQVEAIRTMLKIYLEE